ncbi:MAG: Gfo/Idh/MocA family oxidoreductase [Planctomycetia bacterium]|nr:Gfo/Idh/MocA family oxidoreductase [Planctomycetia bacterium]
MRFRLHRVFIALTVFVSGALPAQAEDAAKSELIKIGIIGLDTSHAPAFTGAINNAKADSPLAGMKVVAAFPGGSSDVHSSHSRVAGFTEQLSKQGVEIVDSVEALLPKVDAILLESVDGRPHLAQARPVFEANKNAAKKKPMFIDKPIAASLADTLEIYRLAEESGTPIFSSSSLRYYPGIAAVNAEKPFGDVLGCLSYGPCSLEEHHPDLFWYGIHGVEILFTIMGDGCESVACVATPDTHVVSGVWKEGRVGTFRGIRSGKSGYGAFVFGSTGAGPAEERKGGGYGPLLVEIAGFFKTGKPPVAKETTINLVAFMEAADESKRLGGKSVLIADILERAKKPSSATSK